VTIWELGGEIIEAVVHPRRLSHLGDDPEGERVASDASEVLAEQVSGSEGGARGLRKVPGPAAAVCAKWPLSDPEAQGGPRAR
jgi:hypothetical protein